VILFSPVNKFTAPDWSAAMVISPVLRGCSACNIDAQDHRLSFRPHVPARLERVFLFTRPGQEQTQSICNFSYSRFNDLIVERKALHNQDRVGSRM